MRLGPGFEASYKTPTLRPAEQRVIMKIAYRVLGLTLLVSACLMPPLFAGKVIAEVGENADFSRYKTYQWLPPRVLTNLGVVENHPGNPLVKEIVGRELSQQGLKELADGADLQIQIHILTESTPQLEALVMPSGSMGMIYGTPVAAMGRWNRAGTLCINLIDPRTKKSAWFGMVTDSLPNGVLKPDELREKLDKAAKKIFKKYPVKK